MMQSSPENEKLQQKLQAGDAWYIDDQFAKQYDRPGPRAVIQGRWEVFESALRAYQASTLDITGHPECRILDAGCGDGINLLGLGQITERNGWRAKIYGVDYNPKRVERARHSHQIVEVINASLASLPYPDGWFSVIICNQVLEHIPDPQLVLQELARVLRKGGVLVLGVPNEGCALARLRNRYLQPSILRTTDHVNFFTSDALRTQLQGEGFTVASVVRSGFFVPHLVVHYVISRFRIGRILLNLLGKLVPSQSAELIAIAHKP